MKRLTLFLALVILAESNALLAQDTLPRFSVKNVGANRIVIGWFNHFDAIRQISIQRSFDSTKNFKSILTVADPTTPENGYVDTKASNDRMFYRLYIMLDKGVYLFSDSKRPVLDTVVTKKAAMSKPDNPIFQVPVIPVDSSYTGPTVTTNNRPKAEVWVPSKHVFTYRDGNITILLPDDADKKYSLKFYNSDDEMIFELKEIKERSFKIDKANFYRAGWFHFELYDSGELIEKNKFFLPKEF